MKDLAEKGDHVIINYPTEESSDLVHLVVSNETTRHNAFTACELQVQMYDDPDVDGEIGFRVDSRTHEPVTCLWCMAGASYL